MENIIKSFQFSTVSKSYFLDIMKSSNEKLYLNIVELKKPKEGVERHAILIFEEDFEEFKRIITATFKEFENQLKFPNAYAKWIAEDDERLEILFCEGKSVKEISAFFHRKPGAIRSRIRKLELKE